MTKGEDCLCGARRPRGFFTLGPHPLWYWVCECGRVWELQSEVTMVLLSGQHSDSGPLLLNEDWAIDPARLPWYLEHRRRITEGELLETHKEWWARIRGLVA